jgi:hypothetical protein
MSWQLNNQKYQNYDNFQNPATPITNGNPNYANYNAKIYFDENEVVPSYELFRGSNNQQQGFQDSLASVIELTSLAQAYFSKPNVDMIQEAIIQRVFMESNGQYRIGRQSDLQLQIVMRSIYLSYGKNLSNNIKGQVDELNRYVVDECMNTVMPNIRQYLTYREEIRTPRKFFDLPINPSSKGEKTFALLNV